MPLLGHIALLCINFRLEGIIFNKAAERCLVQFAVFIDDVTVFYRDLIAFFAAQGEQTDACLILSDIKERFAVIASHADGGAAHANPYRLHLHHDELAAGGPYYAYIFPAVAAGVAEGIPAGHFQICIIFLSVADSVEGNRTA